jgi:GntR family transcriptional regulator
MSLSLQRGDRPAGPKDPPRREQALYVQLAESLRRRIASKDWRIGVQLPPVEDLADEYGVARITVRQAMNILDHEGLVSRSRRRGTHVLNEPVVLRMHHMTAHWDDFMSGNSGGGSKILRNAVAKALPVIAPEQGRVRGEFRHLRLVSYQTGGLPLLLRETFVRRDVYSRIEKRIETTSMMNLLGEQAEEVTIFNQIRAADQSIAGMLRIPLGTPILEGRHIGYDKNASVVFVDMPTLRGDYLRFEIKLKKPPGWSPAKAKETNKATSESADRKRNGKRPVQRDERKEVVR